MRFYGSYDVSVKGITIQNSPQFHLKFDGCTFVRVVNVTISSPENSPNTDGIHVQNSEEVEIHNSSIACGISDLLPKAVFSVLSVRIFKYHFE